MRFHPHTDEEIREMLEAIGVDSIDELFEKIPASIRPDEPLAIPEAVGEARLERELEELAGRNRVSTRTISLAGAGLYEHHVPQTVRHLLLRGEYFTAYTPYQAEVSQGTLMATFEYQTMVAELLGLGVSNASLYDGAHAAAEGALMACRVTRRGRVLVAPSVHPEYTEVVETYFAALDDASVTRLSGGVVDSVESTLPKEGQDVACVIAQTPDVFGTVRDLRAVARWCDEQGALLLIAFNEPLAFAVCAPPGAQGAAIAAGEGSSFGNTVGFGGPGLGMFATHRKFVRQMPGRLVGETRDADGKTGYVLTLSTREQHIRRARATSNICTNQGLLALAAAIYLATLGKEGLVELAELNMSRAAYLHDKLTALRHVEAVNRGPFFNEFTLRLPVDAAELVASIADQHDAVVGVPATRLGLADHPSDLVVAVTETTDRAGLDRVVALFEEAL